jgi:hypothetical protein
MSKETRKTEKTEQDAKAAQLSEQDRNGVRTMLHRLFLVCVLTAVAAVAQNGVTPDPPFFAPQAYQLLNDQSRTEKTLDGQVFGAEYAGRTLNFAQMSAIALKRLVEAAAQKGIPEREITKALYEGRFKPALADLKLAYGGLAPDPTPPFSEQTLSAVKAARDAQWNKRFGSFGEFGETAPPDPNYAGEAASFTAWPASWSKIEATTKDYFFLALHSTLRIRPFVKKSTLKLMGVH